MIDVGGMSPARLNGAVADLAPEPLRFQLLHSLPEPQTPEEVEAVAGLLVLRGIAERTWPIRSGRRELCRFGLCDRVASTHGLCHRHYANGRYGLLRAERFRVVG